MSVDLPLVAGQRRSDLGHGSHLDLRDATFFATDSPISYDEQIPVRDFSESMGRAARLTYRVWPRWNRLECAA